MLELLLLLLPCLTVAYSGMILNPTTVQKQRRHNKTTSNRYVLDADDWLEESFERYERIDIREESIWLELREPWSGRKSAKMMSP